MNLERELEQLDQKWRERLTALKGKARKWQEQNELLRNERVKHKQQVIRA